MPRVESNYFTVAKNHLNSPFKAFTVLCQKASDLHISDPFVYDNYI